MLAQQTITIAELENLLNEELSLLLSGRHGDVLKTAQRISDSIASLSPANADELRSNGSIRELMERLSKIISAQLAQTRAEINSTQTSRKLLRTYHHRTSDAIKEAF